MESFLDYLESPAIVKKAKPSEVTAALALKGQTYEKGMIIIDIPEKKLTDIICRYALSVPWIQLQPGWKIWAKPTFQGQRRWIVTGIEETGNITDNDVLLFDLPAGNMKIKIGTNTIETDGSTSVKINGTNHEVLK